MRALVLVLQVLKIIWCFWETQPLLLIEAAKCLLILSVPRMDGPTEIPNVLIDCVAKPLLRETAQSKSAVKDFVSLDSSRDFCEMT